MNNIISLKACLDEIEETNGDEEFKAWLSSFNFSLRFKFDEGPDTIIRFPKPGYVATTLRDEKVTIKVRVLEYLSQNTTIPVPRLHSWGLTSESPQQLDPETFRITTVLDFEFTNGMPAQFTYDPPWWLLLSGPEAWLDLGCVQVFRDQYEPRMEQFLRALELAEDESTAGEQQLVQPRLSTRMRDSWESVRFWFDCAARKSFDLDVVYWAALHDGLTGVELLDDDARREIEPFIEKKMEQLNAYKEKCVARFSPQVDE
ncbi:Protein kinase-like domain [Fusarium austroafricanum]|uniref:Protein kinase-like domain n=1 Tax=Fusarium austroafricanum TaxID=2364996 RepID=A0A8H4KYB2_9HYPO|nr:Protein kinase-like domain [Fusarium austroafricanum]